MMRKRFSVHSCIILGFSLSVFTNIWDAESLECYHCPMFTSSHTRYRGTGRNDFPHEAICPHRFDISVAKEYLKSGPKGEGNPFCTKIFSESDDKVVARGSVNLDEWERMAFRLEKDGGCIDNPLFNGTDLKFCYCNTDACNSSNIYRSSIQLLSTCVITSIIALNSLRR